MRRNTAPLSLSLEPNNHRVENVLMITEFISAKWKPVSTSEVCEGILRGVGHVKDAGDNSS